MKITEVLDRRADLSTFVVHLTKVTDKGTAKANLLSIIGSQTIRAGKPMGWCQTPEHQRTIVAGESQEIVCFSETPLEHIYSLFAAIEDRQVNLEGYGLAFTKMSARSKGALPVWYVDRTAGADHRWKVPMALDRLREYAVNNQDDVVARDIAAALPHFESTGSWRGVQKEFWWERECRKVGDLQFDWSGVALWFAPEDDHADIGAALLGAMRATEVEDPITPIVLDPLWGLERMIAKLVGFPDGSITPFKTH